MYIPSAFNVTDSAVLARFIQENSFATVVTNAENRPFASHLPILFDASPGPSGKLLGHMARANLQWQHFADGHEALAIFHGPHAYISPRWYESKLVVPTWNYAVVHVYGVPTVIEDEATVAALINRTVEAYEGNGPEAWKGDPDFVSKLLKAIVAFEMPITRIEGKFKLGQNRQPADVAGAYRALSQSGNPADRALAQFMNEWSR
jgi:transcriptional regulator